MRTLIFDGLPKPRFGGAFLSAPSPSFSALDQPQLFCFLPDLVFVSAEHSRCVRVGVPKVEGGSEVFNIHFGQGSPEFASICNAS
jgi:hypothetical protein